MREPWLLVPAVMLAGLVLVSSVAGCEQLAQALGPGATSADASTSDATVAADAGVLGGSCGAESSTGIQLCAATSLCPSVVVDTAAMPHCGFRIRGAVVDIVCGCSSFVCPLGTFATCDEAAAILAKQTEALVCAQIGEDRCTEVTAPVPASTGSTGSTGSSNGGAPGGCDRACVASCGGGASCASLCNCN